MNTLTETELESLKYPIGKHQFAGTLTPQALEKCLADIGNLPARLKKEVVHLPAAKLDIPYRPGGWTLRQVVHHFCDSHMNAFIRFKLALTEDRPNIKPYNEAAWSAMSDNREMAIEPSLELITALHFRWLLVLQSMKPQDLKKSYIHPEYNREYLLEEAISLYAWHCNHHLAHITGLKKRNGWP